MKSQLGIISFALISLASLGSSAFAGETIASAAPVTQRYERISDEFQATCYEGESDSNWFVCVSTTASYPSCDNGNLAVSTHLRIKDSKGSLKAEDTDGLLVPSSPEKATDPVVLNKPHTLTVRTSTICDAVTVLE